jgi:adenylosuccinate synthase
LLKKAEVLVEGCQGTMLSVHTSPYYPYVTSRECTAVGIASEVGISPFDIKRVHGVFRTFPIRVGGNSGDTGADELDWEEVAEYRGAEIVPERTTVTNRQRRIFDFSDSDFQQAVYLNGPTDLYLTFVDYIDAKDQDIINWSQLSVKSKLWITSLEQRHECHIGWVSTGQRPDSYIRR